MTDLDLLRRELAAYFCEDEATFKLDDCIRTFSSFFDSFLKAIEVLIGHTLVLCYASFLYNKTVIFFIFRFNLFSIFLVTARKLSSCKESVNRFVSSENVTVFCVFRTTKFLPHLHNLISTWFYSLCIIKHL